MHGLYVLILPLMVILSLWLIYAPRASGLQSLKINSLIEKSFVEALMSRRMFRRRHCTWKAWAFGTEGSMPLDNVVVQSAALMWKTDCTTEAKRLNHSAGEGHYISNRSGSAALPWMVSYRQYTMERHIENDSHFAKVSYVCRTGFSGVSLRRKRGKNGVIPSLSRSCKAFACQSKG